MKLKEKALEMDVLVGCLRITVEFLKRFRGNEYRLLRPSSIFKWCKEIDDVIHSVFTLDPFHLCFFLGFEASRAG